MDSLKAIFPVLDPPQDGYLSSGEARTFVLTLTKSGDAEAIDDIDSLTLRVKTKEDGLLILSDPVITVLDDGITPALLGQVQVELSESDCAKIAIGRRVAFNVRTVKDSLTKVYWGEFDEVRESIR